VAGERVEWFRGLVATWNAGDVDAFLDGLGPDFTFTPDPSFPDAGTYGGEDLRRWLGEWARTWDESRLELLWTTEVGQAVLAGARWHLTAATRQPIPLRDFHFVVWFDGDRPLRGAAFFEEEQAREAAGRLPG